MIRHRVVVAPQDLTRLPTLAMIPVTSGVVYPGAVVELAKRYRFKSIGGASAGAIAAAAVAAAEYGRTDGGGFARLAQVPDELSTK